MEIASLQTYIEIITTALIVSGITMYMKKDRPRRVWIVEDSEVDRSLLRMNLDANDIAVTYINSAKEFRYKILRPWLYKKPDQVLADYHLEGDTKGTQITALCETNRIECLLMTGDDREILGISPEKIVRKTADDSFYNTISNWLHTKRVSHG